MRSSKGKGFVWCIVAILIVGGCQRRVELTQRRDTLQPIDLVLVIASGQQPANTEQQEPSMEPQFGDQSLVGLSHRSLLALDDKQEIFAQVTVQCMEVTRSTPNTEDVVRDLNIFLFHKERDTIVRHYYFFNHSAPYLPAQIHLPDLYVGNYHLFVVANNGKSLCDHSADNISKCPLKLADMDTLRSSVIVADNQFSVMTYRDDNFKIIRNKQPFDLTLNRKSAFVEIDIVNNFNSEAGLEYMIFNNYSVFNVPSKVSLFAQTATVVKEDINNSTGATLSGESETNINTSFVMLPNEQGLVAASGAPCYFDRNSSLAPSLASYAIFNATHFIGAKRQAVSYQFYLGQAGKDFNEYNVIPGNKYRYRITFDKPNTEDPRVMTLSVNNDKVPFKDADGKSTNIAKGGVVSRELSVDYSTALSNRLLLSCELSMYEPPKNYSFTVYKKSGDHWMEWGESVNASLLMLDLPDPTPHPITPNFGNVEVKVCYTQKEASKSRLRLSLQTTLGQSYEIWLTRIESYQEITFIE